MSAIPGTTAILPLLLITTSIAFSRFFSAGEDKDPEKTSLTSRLLRRRSHNEEPLASEILFGLESIVSRSRYFRNQIQLLRTVIRQNVNRSLPLEESKAKKFNENSRHIDILADKYTILYSQLTELFEHEKVITSPEILREQRQKEFEAIRQLSALSDQIEPLISENERIASYIAKSPDEEGASA